MSRDRFLNLIVGAERGGKSYFAEGIMNKYCERGGMSLIYNQGKPSDFSSFEFIEIPDKMDVAAKIRSKQARTAFLFNPHLPYFLDEDGVKRIKPVDIIKPGAKYRVYRNGCTRMEAAFFKFAFLYLHDCIFTIDDARSITRKGLTEQLVTLFSRKNHAGRKTRPTGVDIQVIYHDLDTVPDEILTYCTHFTLFRVNIMPEKFGNIALYNIVKKCVNELNDLPKYSKAVIDVKGLTYSIIKPK